MKLRFELDELIKKELGITWTDNTGECVKCRHKKERVEIFRQKIRQIILSWTREYLDKNQEALKLLEREI